MNLNFKNLIVYIDPIVNVNLQDTSFIFIESDPYYIVLNNITFNNVSLARLDKLGCEFIVKADNLDKKFNVIIERLYYFQNNFADSLIFFVKKLI